jgi:hypothetical protein
MSINLFSDLKYYVVINEDGWSLPSLKEFTIVAKRKLLKNLATDPSIKNCYYEFYIPKTKPMVINLPACRYEKVYSFYGTIPALKIKTEKYLITGLTVYYYKTQRFCLELEIQDNEPCSYTIANFVDIDLDGKFESEVVLVDPIKFFLKFSPKVADEDRFKAPLW